MERTYLRPYLSGESLNFAQASAHISCRYFAGVTLITVRRAVVSKTVTVELMSGLFAEGCCGGGAERATEPLEKPGDGKVGDLKRLQSRKLTRSVERTFM